MERRDSGRWIDSVRYSRWEVAACVCRPLCPWLEVSGGPFGVLVCPSVRLSVRPSVCSFVRRSFCPSVECCRFSSSVEVSRGLGRNSCPEVFLGSFGCCSVVLFVMSLISVGTSGHLSPDLFVCPSGCFSSVCLSVCPSVCPSVRPCVRLSVGPPVRLSVCPSVRAFVRVSVCPSVRPSVFPGVGITRCSVCSDLRVCVCKRPAIALEF